MSGELVELGRRLKRSLDGYLSYRRAAAIAVVTLGQLFWLRGTCVDLGGELCSAHAQLSPHLSLLYCSFADPDRLPGFV